MNQLSIIHESDLDRFACADNVAAAAAAADYDDNNAVGPIITAIQRQ